MPALLEQLLEQRGIVIGLSIASVVMFVGSLLAVPFIVARAPRDYFTRQDGRESASLPLKVLKNLAGGLMLSAGVLMLLLPGQGVLTLLVGLALLDVPGKHALQVRLARRPGVLTALNYVRKKTKREPFDPP